MSLRRAAAIVRKEILHIIRDPRNLFLVTVSPAFLLFLLSYIFSFDVGQFSIAVLDLDRTSLSRLYLDSLTSDQDLILVYTVGSYEEIDPLLVSGDIDAALVIPPGFANTVHSVSMLAASIKGHPELGAFSGERQRLGIEVECIGRVTRQVHGLANHRLSRML